MAIFFKLLKFVKCEFSSYGQRLKRSTHTWSICGGLFCASVADIPSYERPGAPHRSHSRSLLTGYDATVTCFRSTWPSTDAVADRYLNTHQFFSLPVFRLLI